MADSDSQTPGQAPRVTYARSSGKQATAYYDNPPTWGALPVYSSPTGAIEQALNDLLDGAGLESGADRVAVARQNPLDTQGPRTTIIITGRGHLQREMMLGGEIWIVRPDSHGGYTRVAKCPDAPSVLRRLAARSSSGAATKAAEMRGVCAAYPGYVCLAKAAETGEKFGEKLW